MKNSRFLSRLASVLAISFGIHQLSAQIAIDLPIDGGDGTDFQDFLDNGDYNFTDGDYNFTDGEYNFDSELPNDEGILYTLGASNAVIFDSVSAHSLVSSGLPMAAAVRQVNFANTRSILSDVNGRIFRHRAGLGARFSESAPLPTTASLSKDGKATLPAETTVPTLQHWEIFAAGNFGQTDLDSIDSQAGFKGDSWSGTIGAEYHFTPNFTFGAAFSYGSSDYDFSDGLGSVHLESPTGAVYFSYANQAFYADLLYSYGASDLSIHRNALFGASDYRGDTDSSQHVGELNTGYNFVLAEGHLITGPTAELSYLNGETDGYDEKTVGPAGLRFDKQNYESLISQIGWQVSGKIAAGKVTFVPQVHAAWAHEFLDKADVVQATLLESPVHAPFGNGPANSFSATQATARPGTDYLTAGAGVAVLICDNWSVNLAYEGEFFRDNSTAHYASVRAAFSF